MEKPIYESDIEEMAIQEFISNGYDYLCGNDLSINSQPLRDNESQVILNPILYDTICRINPDIPYEVIKSGLSRAIDLTSHLQVDKNNEFHNYLKNGIPVEFDIQGEIVGDIVKLIDFENPDNNHFLAVNQLTIVNDSWAKRPDIILFINGIPLVLIELKNPIDENATIEKAYNQINNYKITIPSLFDYNEICIISDGLEARVGSLTADLSRYSTWKLKEDSLSDSFVFQDELTTMISGLLKKQTLIDYIENFVTFEESKKRLADGTQRVLLKKIAAYHQYYAVNRAIDRTLIASGCLPKGSHDTRLENIKLGDHKAGVIWHTQGSGKSLSMVFYVAKITKLLNNPTILVINDRNDLDNQLFNTFANNNVLLGQKPVQAESCSNLKELLKVGSGGVVFSTIQKFTPENSSDFQCLSTRENVVVIADEAHRSQYGLEAKIKDVKHGGQIIGKQISYGFAKYLRDALPNATFLGFTGTPVEKKDINTPALFGDYIDIYDIAQAVEDHATVPIYYESRLAQVGLTEEGKNLIREFDESIAEYPSEIEKPNLNAAKLEAIVGNKERLKKLAQDIVKHFEIRDNTISGKAMIVCMSRKIAVDLYNEIVAIKPNWEGNNLETGAIKVVITSNSSDGPEFAKHQTTKKQREQLANRFRDENDQLKLVIVRDMWLTGFDAPCLSTMYIDKPMKDQNLMQAIARVNRVFKDKPGGLIVDYIGIANSLKQALGFYADSGGKGHPIETQEKAKDILIEKLNVIRDMLYGFDYSAYSNCSTKELLSLILRTENYILGLENGKKRFIKEVSLLGQAYSLSKSDSEIAEFTDEIAFFQAVKARLVKFDQPSEKNNHSSETIIKDIINSSLETKEIVDIFDAAGLVKPELSVLSDDFLDQIGKYKYKNVALEVLKKLLNDQISIKGRSNIIQSKSLLDRLNGAINKYQNNLLDTSSTIQELITIAKGINNEEDREKDLHLSNNELAVFDILASPETIYDFFSQEDLISMAKELVINIKNKISIDFSIRESAKARIKVLIRRTLNRNQYPTEYQDEIVNLIMRQTELFNKG